MNQLSANSSPDLTCPQTSSTTPNESEYDDSALEGVSANIKLLLKLTQDHKNACDKEKNGCRRMLRVATMMTILDNIRARIRKWQSFYNNEAPDRPKLHRSNTIPQPKKSRLADYEKEQLRRVQKNLQAMCSSLVKEKEIMTAELHRKVQELNGMEELVNDLKMQNENLLEKVKGKEPMGASDEVHKRNKVLSEDLLKSLDKYQSMKRKLKEAEEENWCMRAAMDEMRGKLVGSLERVKRFEELIVLEIGELEGILECFGVMVVRNNYKHMMIK